MGRLDHPDMYNGDVKVDPSEFPFEYNSESVPNPYTNPIKTIDDDIMDHLLELFHSSYDDDLFGVDIHMLQA